MSESNEDDRTKRRRGPRYASCHAMRRMRSRGLPPSVVRQVLDYGRHAWVRGACIFVLGRRDVTRLRQLGIDASAANGVHVVCSPDGTVLTTYRNHDLRGLRPRGPRRWGGRVRIGGRRIGGA